VCFTSVQVVPIAAVAFRAAWVARRADPADSSPDVPEFDGGASTELDHESTDEPVGASSRSL
jgi:hypothetical protein